VTDHADKQPLLDPVGDLLALAGSGCVVGGVWWIYAPGGLILLGLVVLVAAVVRARG
jgi:hypothetical protein